MEVYARPEAFVSLVSFLEESGKNTIFPSGI
jgi:hypothetical protein